MGGIADKVRKKIFRAVFPASDTEWLCGVLQRLKEKVGGVGAAVKLEGFSC